MIDTNRQNVVMNATDMMCDNYILMRTIEKSTRYFIFMT